MVRHVDLESGDIFRMIKNHSITVAGNSRLKIYGQLDCVSGKRMKKENRVFFKTERDAVFYGFRPCGHCMSSCYSVWKRNLQK